MVQFIYRPRSGDRVFAVKTHEEIASVEWRNGSRHVAGGCHLWWTASCPGAWWRSDAVTMAAAIVRRYGGIGWDDQGTVCLIVPVRAAVQAAKLMEAVAPAFRQIPGEEWASVAQRQEWLEADRLANLARLVLAGWGLPEEGETWPRLFSGGEVPRRWAAHWTTKWAEKEKEEDKCEVVLEWAIPGEPMPGGRTTTQTITAPASWGPPRIWGCSTTEHKEEPAAPTVTTITVTREDLRKVDLSFKWAQAMAEEKFLTIPDDAMEAEIPLSWFEGACEDGQALLRAAKERIAAQAPVVE